MRLVEAAGDGLIGVLICDDDAAIRGMLRSVVELRPSLRTVGEAATETKPSPRRRASNLT